MTDLSATLRAAEMANRQRIAQLESYVARAQELRREACHGGPVTDQLAADLAEAEGVEREAQGELLELRQRAARLAVARQAVDEVAAWVLPGSEAGGHPRRATALGVSRQ